MRIAYLDDSGTGTIEHDPNAVIAGVVVNPDRQLHASNWPNSLCELQWAAIHAAQEHFNRIFD